MSADGISISFLGRKQRPEEKKWSDAAVAHFGRNDVSLELLENHYVAHTAPYGVVLKFQETALVTPLTLTDDIGTISLLFQLKNTGIDALSLDRFTDATPSTKLPGDQFAILRRVKLDELDTVVEDSHFLYLRMQSPTVYDAVAALTFTACKNGDTYGQMMSSTVPVEKANGLSGDDVFGVSEEGLQKMFVLAREDAVSVARSIASTLDLQFAQTDEHLINGEMVNLPRPLMEQWSGFMKRKDGVVTIGSGAVASDQNVLVHRGGLLAPAILYASGVGRDFAPVSPPVLVPRDRVPVDTTKFINHSKYQSSISARFSAGDTGSSPELSENMYGTVAQRQAAIKDALHATSEEKFTVVYSHLPPLDPRDIPLADGDVS